MVVDYLKVGETEKEETREKKNVVGCLKIWDEYFNYFINKKGVILVRTDGKRKLVIFSGTKEYFILSTKLNKYSLRPLNFVTFWPNTDFKKCKRKWVEKISRMNVSPTFKY